MIKIQRKLVFCLSCLVIIELAIGSRAAYSQQDSTTPVVPHLEMKVIDPKVDPLGNPASRVNEDGTQIEIPPTIVVHPYYYSGDRTFRGPMLPGGPTIVVVKHPETFEQCYLELQMLAGSPIVTYTKKEIEYDFGETRISLRFGKCDSKVVIKNGKRIEDAVDDKLHLTEFKASFQERSEVTKKALKGAAGEAKDAMKVVTLPAQNLVRYLPLGTALTDGSLKARLIEKADIEEREKEAKAYINKAKIDELTRKTIR